MATLPPVTLGAHILAAFAIALSLRPLLEKRWVTSAEEILQPVRQFELDQSLGAVAALCARAVVEAGATDRQAAPWPDLETAKNTVNISPGNSASAADFFPLLPVDRFDGKKRVYVKTVCLVGRHPACRSMR